MTSLFRLLSLFCWMLLSISVTSTALYAGEKEKYAVEMVQMYEPPFDYYSAEGIVSDEKRYLGLEEIAATANNIIDEEAWFQDNALQLGSSTKVPPAVAGVIDGHKLLRAIPGEDYLSLIYADDQGEGRYLFLWSMKSRRYAYGFDFGKYLLAPGGSKVDRLVVIQAIDWVVVREHVLYISHSHKTYADSSRGLNGYITAIDLNTRGLLWRSAPLVSNAANFVVIGNTVISGYGFSAEPDYLYLLDSSNGKQVGRIALRTGPRYIIHKDDLVYVRTYNTDYQFRIVQRWSELDASPVEPPEKSEQEQLPDAPQNGEKQRE